MNFVFGPNITLTCNQVFYFSELSYATVNLKPFVPGHILVCPRRMVRRYNELKKEEILDLFTTVQKVGEVVQNKFGCTSLTISIQDGPDSGQTVNHVHVHVIPRKPKDFKNNDDIYVELENHDKDNRQPRTQEEMKKECDWLRSFFI